MENLDLLYALFNQYLFQDAKNRIQDLKYYYNINPSTSNNPLVQELLNAIDTYTLDSIDMPLFQSIIQKSGKSQVEANQILGEIVKWKKYSKEQILPCKQFLDELSAKALISRASQFQNPTEYVKYIRNSAFLTSDIDVFTSINLSKVDINSIIAEQSREIIKSGFDFVNRSFEPQHGYEKGQLVIVVAAPSTGKSLFLMAEALYMALSKHKVLYLALGDLKLRDFVVRMSAIYSGLPFGDAAMNLGSIATSLKRDIGDNLEISINAAGKVGAEDIVEYVKSRSDFEVIIVDYDSNLKGANDSDSMYNNLGNIYTKLNELVLMDKLLYVACQPKIGVWGEPVIQISDLGESAKKAHIADTILTIGREKECPNHLHTCYVAKNRRGENTKAYTIRLNNGRFKEIPKSLYDKLKVETDKKDYQESEMDRMIEEELRSQSRLGQALNNLGIGNNSPQVSTPQPKTLLNPFTTMPKTTI